MLCLRANYGAPYRSRPYGYLSRIPFRFAVLT